MNTSGITRKDFIKSSALAVAGLAFTPGLLSAGTFDQAKDHSVAGKKKSDAEKCKT